MGSSQLLGIEEKEFGYPDARCSLLEKRRQVECPLRYGLFLGDWGLPGNNEELEVSLSCDISQPEVSFFAPLSSTGLESFGEWPAIGPLGGMDLVNDEGETGKDGGQDRRGLNSGFSWFGGEEKGDGHSPARVGVEGALKDLLWREALPGFEKDPVWPLLGHPQALG